MEYAIRAPRPRRAPASGKAKQAVLSHAPSAASSHSYRIPTRQGS
ncbi:MAG TPA: hypothetical protein QF683_01460 [SAR324 cluster bacterium]|nr:hypothetical protein [SAR324 cluster bacterium]